MNHFDFDLFVIGGGSGGVRAARMAAQRKQGGVPVRVGLAEALGTEGLGGTCVNVGCIPKKLYSYAAHYSEAFEESHGFGWEGAAPTFNWATLKKNRKAEISRLNGIYLNLLKGSGVQVFNAFARLLDGHTLEVSGKRITARHILVATGGQPHVPEFKGRELVVTSNAMFDLEPFPKRLLVVGGGYIACEFASIFNGLGAQVTQLYRGEQVLRGFDDDVRGFIATEMRKTGVDLRLDADVAHIEKSAHGLKVALLDGGELEVDTVLYATGRVPHVKGMGLDMAGVAQGKDGAVIVNDDYQTSVPSIYAVGDVTAAHPCGAGRGDGGGRPALWPAGGQTETRHELPVHPHRRVHAPEHRHGGVFRVGGAGKIWQGDDF
jgi:glutathione reductase (NADPH)